MKFHKQYESKKPKRIIGKKNLILSPNAQHEIDQKEYEAFLSDWESCRDRHDGQKEIINAVFEENLQYVFIRAGRKWAKTTTLIDICWKKAHLTPRSVIYLCYPTIAQAVEVVWEERRLQTCDRKDDYMFEKYVVKCDEVRHILWFANGSFVKLIGTWSEARGRGSQPDMMIFDEMQDSDENYIEAMDSNLAAKNAPAIFSGTPPKAPNHYQDWEKRIAANPRGRTFHWTSYDNPRLPHLKGWLDNKCAELISAGKEDVWRREYLAEDCFSSADRVLPDPTFHPHPIIVANASNFAYNQRSPVLGISIHAKFFCAIFGVLISQKTLFVYDFLIFPEVWFRSFKQMHEDVAAKFKEVIETCGAAPRRVIWDTSKSFADVVAGYPPCRDDVKWQDRGIPLLREMMLNGKIQLSENLKQLSFECQKLFMDEPRKSVEDNYPLICTLAMLANEHFAVDPAKPAGEERFDIYQPLRDAGIVCPSRDETHIKRFLHKIFRSRE